MPVRLSSRQPPESFDSEQPNTSSLGPRTECTRRCTLALARRVEDTSWQRFSNFEGKASQKRLKGQACGLKLWSCFVQSGSKDNLGGPKMQGRTKDLSVKRCFCHYSRMPRPHLTEKHNTQLRSTVCCVSACFGLADGMRAGEKQNVQDQRV